MENPDRAFTLGLLENAMRELISISFKGNSFKISEFLVVSKTNQGRGALEFLQQCQ